LDSINKLLEPLTFPNRQTAPNRVWLAPMTNMQSHDDGSLSTDELNWLLARAQGGFGVIESCATHVAPDGKAWPGELGCFDLATASSWAPLVQAVQPHRSLLLAQLFHGGSRASEAKNPWSCIPSKGVAQGDEAQIEQTINDFIQAAKRLSEIGVGGVELHGAHGYLLCQFLSRSNTRADGWGTSLEDRARLIRRVMRGVRAAVPASFVVGVRLSPEDSFVTKGLDLDETIQTARWLGEDGADFIHISLWDASKNSIKYKDTHPARLFRDALPADVPIITAGQIWTLDDALAQLDHGADAVALGRSGIANPDWPQRVALRGESPKRPPLTRAELAERALSPRFIDYMSRWDGFVSDK
jgi:2,4-dienoyl-CoA reductase-like NADH-dependent reductase (Old Yellow Enzyme family)